MKIALYIGAGLIIIVILLELFSAREIYTEIEINASANSVWEVLTTFDEYPDWNPFIREISGELSEGSRLSVSIQPVDSDPMNFQPTLIKADKNHELRWMGRVLVRGIFDGEHYLIIEKISEEKVNLIHGENFSGALVPLLRLLQIRFKLIIINILRIFYLLIVSENSFQKQVNYGLY